MDILFVTATRIGDAVLSTGLIAYLIERPPGARLTRCDEIVQRLAPILRESVGARRFEAPSAERR